jgi:hypothetical protein
LGSGSDDWHRPRISPQSGRNCRLKGRAAGAYGNIAHVLSGDIWDGYSGISDITARGIRNGKAGVAAYLEHLAAERRVRQKMPSAVRVTEDSRYHDAACGVGRLNGRIQCR